MATARKYDLYSDRFRAETYETFARMRDEDGVFCQQGIDGETMLWFITRHDDAMAVLLDDERFEELYWRPVPLFRSLASLKVAW